MNGIVKQAFIHHKKPQLLNSPPPLSTDVLYMHDPKNIYSYIQKQQVQKCWLDNAVDNYMRTTCKIEHKFKIGAAGLESGALIKRYVWERLSGLT